MPYPVITQITPLPPRGSDPAVFTAGYNTWFAEQPQFIADVNAAGSYVETTAGEVEQNAQDASDAASTASDSADAAANSAQSASDDADRAESAVAALPEGTIADEIVAPDKVWSSQKTSDELGLKRDLTDTHFPRYDLASAAVTDTLDLAASNVFRVDASSPRTLAFDNAPGADRAMTVVIHISGNSAVTLMPELSDPDAWDEGALPTLGDVKTEVIAFWGGEAWSAFVKVAK